MNLSQTYLQIDELFAEYLSDVDNNKDAIKTKLLKIICEVIKNDSKFKQYFLNGDIDYLPILTATNDALKYFKTDYKDSCFHKYLFKCIKNSLFKEISVNQQGNVLDYEKIKLLKRIKKLLILYKNDKQKVASALNISVSKLDSLINMSNVDSLNRTVNNDSSKIEIESLLPSRTSGIEENIFIIENVAEDLSLIEIAWKKVKEKHQSIISDWLSAKIIKELDEKNLLLLIGKTEDVLSFLEKYNFINIDIVKNYLFDNKYSLPITYDLIAIRHNVTKSAVSKKVNKFIEIVKN